MVPSNGKMFSALLILTKVTFWDTLVYVHSNCDYGNKLNFGLGFDNIDNQTNKLLRDPGGTAKNRLCKISQELLRVGK